MKESTTFPTRNASGAREQPRKKRRIGGRVKYRRGVNQTLMHRYGKKNPNSINKNKLGLILLSHRQRGYDDNYLYSLTSNLNHNSPQPQSTTKHEPIRRKNPAFRAHQALTSRVKTQAKQKRWAIRRERKRERREIGKL